MRSSYHQLIDWSSIDFVLCYLYLWEETDAIFSHFNVPFIWDGLYIIYFPDFGESLLYGCVGVMILAKISKVCHFVIEEKASYWGIVSCDEISLILRNYLLQLFNCSPHFFIKSIHLILCDEYLVIDSSCECESKRFEERISKVILISWKILVCSGPLYYILAIVLHDLGIRFTQINHDSTAFPKKTKSPFWSTGILPKLYILRKSLLWFYCLRTLAKTKSQGILPMSSKNLTPLAGWLSRLQKRISLFMRAI